MDALVIVLSVFANLFQITVRLRVKKFVAEIRHRC